MITPGGRELRLSAILAFEYNDESMLIRLYNSPHDGAEWYHQRQRTQARSPLTICTYTPLVRSHHTIKHNQLNTPAATPSSTPHSPSHISQLYPD